jgi:hypothetical protein
MRCSSKRITGYGLEFYDEFIVLFKLYVMRKRTLHWQAIFVKRKTRIWFIFTYHRNWFGKRVSKNPRVLKL